LEEKMKVEFNWNTFWDGEWWFDLGISYQNVYHHEYKKVLTVGLGWATIYFRWNKNVK
jgi:hypothetical protein